jgi:hypothetical protein
MYQGLKFPLTLNRNQKIWKQILSKYSTEPKLTKRTSQSDHSQNQQRLFPLC